MSALEREIIEKVTKLDEERQLRVLEFIESIDQPQMTLSEWLELARESRAELQVKYGTDFVVGSQSLLDETREERLDDLLGSR